MQEVDDHYIGAEILLPKGDEMAWGNLVGWSCHARRNVMGRAHVNPMIDIRMCQVEFAGGKVTELTSNIIAESMYAQCNADVNEYLLLDALYLKDNNAISLTDQQIAVWGRLVTCMTTAG